MAPKKFKVRYMKIGIDISQIVHEGAGVAKYVREMVRALVQSDSKNDYILFAASIRRRHLFYQYIEKIHSGNLGSRNVRLVVVPIPPTVLDILWNRLHIVPVEWFTGHLDVFWSSDWTQPPLGKAVGITTIHDLTVIRYPETFAKKIVDVHRRRLQWVTRECKKILCDSEATKNDATTLLGILPEKLHVVYPGL